MEAAIFDLDGTLIDLFEVHYRAFHDSIKEASGLDFTREDLIKAYGLKTENVAVMFFKEQGVTGIKLEKIMEAREKIVLNHLSEPKVLPGAVKLLEKLKDANIKLAVGTTSRRNMTLKTLSVSGLKKYFDVVSTITDVSQGKPAPDIFLSAAERMNATPEHCVVFEDSPYGIKAAKAARMKAVAVLYDSHHTSENLAKENPDLVVQSLEYIDLAKLDSLFY